MAPPTRPRFGLGDGIYNSSTSTRWWFGWTACTNLPPLRGGGLAGRHIQIFHLYEVVVWVDGIYNSSTSTRWWFGWSACTNLPPLRGGGLGGRHVQIFHLYEVVVWWMACTNLPPLRGGGLGGRHVQFLILYRDPPHEGIVIQCFMLYEHQSASGYGAL